MTAAKKPRRRSAADALSATEREFVAGEPPKPARGSAKRTAGDTLLVRAADDTLERVRRAAAALSTTATKIVLHGIRAEVERLERLHNRGKPFDPPRDPYSAD